jgi:hypothetical protein
VLHICVEYDGTRYRIFQVGTSEVVEEILQNGALQSMDDVLVYAHELILQLTVVVQRLHAAG